MVYPKVSVITVSYNAIATIEKTILSVISQTYDNIEYIIIDGGSKDGTVEVIKKYSDKISKWISEPDGGIYYAMNKGIQLASGEWIHFRNCGDYFVSNDILSILFAGKDYSDIDIIHGNCIYFNSWGYRSYRPAIIQESYKVTMPVIHSSAFIRTELHKQWPFNTQYRSSADYDFFYRCLEANKVFYYININISLFNQVGFSTQNANLAYRENYHIQGRDRTVVGKALFRIIILYRIVMSFGKGMIEKCFRNVENIKRNRMLQSGWKVLPFPEDLKHIE